MLIKEVFAQYKKGGAKVIAKIVDYLGFSETTFYELRCRDLIVSAAYKRGSFAYKNRFLHYIKRGGNIRVWGLFYKIGNNAIEG